MSGGDRYALRQLAIVPVAVFLTLGGGVALLAVRRLARLVRR